MRGRLSWVRVVAFGMLTISLVLGGEIGQAIAERISYARGAKGTLETLTNRHRSRHDPDRQVLRASVALRMIARKQARAMYIAGFHYHTPTGRLCRTVVHKIPSSVHIGENVGMAWTADGMFQRFLQSYAHHANIHRPGYNLQAVGAMRSGEGYLFASHVFTEKRPGFRSTEKCPDDPPSDDREHRRGDDGTTASPTPRTEQSPSPRTEPSPSPRTEPSPSASPAGRTAAPPFPRTTAQLGRIVEDLVLPPPPDGALVLGVRIPVAGGEVIQPETDAAADVPDVGLLSALRVLLGQSVSNVGRGLSFLAFWR